jgi:hypothetical protein
VCELPITPGVFALASAAWRMTCSIAMGSDHVWILPMLRKVPSSSQRGEPIGRQAMASAVSMRAWSLLMLMGVAPASSLDPQRGEDAWGLRPGNKGERGIGELGSA